MKEETGALVQPLVTLEECNMLKFPNAEINLKLELCCSTCVAAFNINGITIHLFFEMADSSQDPNYLRLGEIERLYPKVMLLDVMNDALIRTTQRATAMDVDQNLISVLNKVRVSKFDEDVITFINSRTVLKNNLSQKCLRLYTTRSNVDRAILKEFKRLEGESIYVPAFNIYNGD
ncbi:hypothetical protein CU097_010382 [Rhizopus azygosporus]|uniref:Uncharacterized protein n=1 Tax=Rhizopus azygosporus TaxID=86630 RepID=A0A367K2J0_RHIAZ|nr:hypothetical protein CU097_010382 [Rhizopus azygosporus]